MDIAVLTAFLAPFLPFLMKLGNKVVEGAAQKSGEDGWDKAKAVWEKLHPKVEAKEEAKLAVQQVVAKPESEARIAVLQEELETLLKENPDLAAAIAKIMQSDSEAATSNVTNIAQKMGDNANVVGQMNDTGSVDFSRKS
jgi:transcription elongation factor GreA-like protein